MLRVIFFPIVLLVLAGVTLADIPRPEGKRVEVCPKVFMYKPLSNCKSKDGCTGDGSNSCASTQKCCPAENGCNLICRTPDITPKDSCHLPIDLALLFDVTSNINSDDFKKAKRFAKYLVDSFDISSSGTHIAIMTYRSGADTHVRLVDRVNKRIDGISIKDTIDNLSQSNDKIADVYEALNEAETYIFTQQAGMRTFRKVCVIIGNRVKNGETRLVQVSKRLREKGVDIFALGMGRNFDRSALKKVTNNPDRVFDSATFRGLYNGLQTIKDLQCSKPSCNQSIDLAIVLDNSGSISKTQWPVFQSFARDIVNSFIISPTKTRVAFMTFNTRPALHVNFGRNANDILNAIKQAKRSNGLTYINRALDMAYNQIFTDGKTRPNAKRVCLVVTDGRNTKNISAPGENAFKLRQASRLLRRNGVSIFALGLENKSDRNELTNITGDNSRVFMANNVNSLTTKVAEISYQQCKSCSLPVDLALVLDNSGSIRKKEWKQVLDFASFLTNVYAISEKETHVAVVTFSEYPKVKVKFNTYTGKQLTNEKIESVLQDIGSKRKGWLRTKIDKALKIADGEVFTKKAGMRGRNAIKVCVVITDGGQTNETEVPLDVASKPLKDKGVTVFSLAVGSKRRQKQNQLRKIASGPEYVVKPQSFMSLPKMIEELQLEACKRKQILDLPDEDDDIEDQLGSEEEYVESGEPEGESGSIEV